MITVVRGNNPCTAERLVGRTVLFLGSRPPVRIRRRSRTSVAELFRCAGRWPFERWFAFRKKRTRWPKSSGCHRRRLRPNRPAIAIPRIAKELVRRFHAKQLVTAMPGLDLSRLRLATWTAKKCLPSLPWCGTIWVDLLGGGRPASNCWPTYATHEPWDGPTRR